MPLTISIPDMYMYLYLWCGSVHVYYTCRSANLWLSNCNNFVPRPTIMTPVYTRIWKAGNGLYYVLYKAPNAPSTTNHSLALSVVQVVELPLVKSESVKISLNVNAIIGMVYPRYMHVYASLMIVHPRAQNNHNDNWYVSHLHVHIKHTRSWNIKNKVPKVHYIDSCFNLVGPRQCSAALSGPVTSVENLMHQGRHLNKLEVLKHLWIS